MSAPVDTEDIRTRVTAMPGVVRVHGRGPNGVSADDTEVEVHVVARYGEVLPDLAQQVDRELAPVLGGRTLRLVVDDVVTAAEEAQEHAREQAARERDTTDAAGEPDDAAPAALPVGDGADTPALTARPTPPALPPASHGDHA